MKKQNNAIIGIYKITNKETGNAYVGQSTNLERRKRQYTYPNETKQQIRLNRSIQKYGIELHEFEILEECTLELLDDREIYWGEFYESLGPKGLNCRLGQGRGVLSDELKERMKISNSRKRIKPILQYSLKGDFIKEWGALWDAEKFLKVDNHSNISACCQGKQHSAFGFIWRLKEDGEFPLKIKAAPHKRSVQQFDKNNTLIENWDDYLDAAKKYNIHFSGINNCCIGKQKSAAGFIWKFKE
jgi:hypothetical protein